LQTRELTAKFGVAWKAFSSEVVDPVRVKKTRQNKKEKE
jgi:hypothetical protein